jgi:probable phosphoglycerate mutase
LSVPVSYSVQLPCREAESGDRRPTGGDVGPAPAADAPEVVTNVTLILVRHGETAWNRTRTIQGHIDIALNSTGQAQADAVARRLSGAAVAAVHASDLGRAWQTATAIAAPHRLPVVAEPDLRERHWGRLQGLRIEHIARHWPDDHARMVARDPYFAPDGGESIIELVARVRAVLMRIAAAVAGRTAVVVTHGGVLDAAYRIATNLPLEVPRPFVLANAAVNVLEGNGATWRVRCWGDVGHLGGIERRDELN